MSNLIFVDLEQGSEEWHEFRRGKIGASDASVIMGSNPWKTPRQLYEQHQTGERTAMNPAMEKGVRLEPVARQKFIDRYGIEMKPSVFYREHCPYIIASLDGINEDWEKVIEIKCGGRTLHEMVKKGEIPEYYMAQVQHHFAVVQPNEYYFCSYLEEDDDLAVIEIFKDDKLIEKIVEAEEAFYWNHLAVNEPPELTDADYEEWESDEANALLAEYIHSCKLEKHHKEIKEGIKKRLIELSPKRSCILNGTKIYQSSRVSYDTKSMRQDGINVENYKKVSAPFWVLSPPRASREIGS